MPLYQCDKCGCVENTALSNAAHPAMLNGPIVTDLKAKQALESYRKILGLESHQPFGKYCSGCSPIWFNEFGVYGIGPNPRPIEGEGKWHGKFAQKFYPLGILFTDQNGNIGSRVPNWRALERSAQWTTSAENPPAH